jgi:hypothetical protein
MDVQEVLGLWWTVPAGLAVLGYGCSLAGVTRAQRAVWATARIVEVRRPAHGDSRKPGIQVTVAFQDPATGQEFTLPNAGRHGDPVHEAWLGREFPVRYPRGRPERFHLMTDVFGERGGLVGPSCAVVLLLLGLVIQATVTWGYPWALLGFGGLLTAAMLLSRDLGLMRARAALLASAVAVPGQVVAVTKDVETDGEGTTFVCHEPVVAFTTREGTRVTALCREGIPDPGRSLGRDLTIHYAPADPAVFTPDPDHDRRDRAKTVALVVASLLTGIAAVVAGVVTL